jgi:hypothetical protein
VGPEGVAPNPGEATGSATAGALGQLAPVVGAVQGAGTSANAAAEGPPRHALDRTEPPPANLAAPAGAGTHAPGAPMLPPAVQSVP